MIAQPFKKSTLKQPLEVVLSDGVRLMSEEKFLQELSPLGLSKRGFRALCHSLRVPIIHIGRYRLVDRLSFLLAMRAISRVGQPDFAMPGSEPVDDGRGKQFARELDPDYFTANVRVFLSELLSARYLTGLHKMHFHRQIKSAAERMVASFVAAASSMEQDKLGNVDLLRELENAQT